MKMKTLHNPTDQKITDYPIEEVDFDQNGNAILDQEGKPKHTGRTLTWSLGSGETMEFPYYVADYLKFIYDFLKIEELSVSEAKVEPTTVAESAEGIVVCKHCGESLKGMKGYGLHVAHKHTDLLKAV